MGSRFYTKTDGEEIMCTALSVYVYKKCSKCRYFVEIKNFTADSSNKDGKCEKCKDCQKRYRAANKYIIKERDYQYHKNNKDKVSIKQKEYNKRNKEEISRQRKQHRQDNIDYFKERNHEYYENNRSEISIKQREYYEKNKEEILKKAKAHGLLPEVKQAKSLSGKEYYKDNKEHVLKTIELWRQKNKEKYNEICRDKCRKRRAKKRGVKENYTCLDEEITKQIFKNKCFNCKSTNNLTIDHHHCLDKGNALTIGNAVLLCRKCNGSKSDREPVDFYTKEQIKDIEELFKIATQLKINVENL